MSEQSSRLVIILDSSGAQRNSESLADALNRLTAQGERRDRGNRQPRFFIQTPCSIGSRCAIYRCSYKNSRRLGASCSTN